MAATSYTALPSSSYVGLGSDGDLYHDANFGSYGTGIGSLTSHPYEYQTRTFANDLTDNYQPNSYSEEFLRSVHAHGDHSIEQQPDYYSNDKYANESSSVNNHPTQGLHRDDNYITEPLHKTTNDYQQHHASHSDTIQHHQPVPTDNYHHPSSPKSQRHHPVSTHAGPHPSDHPTSPKSQRHHAASTHAGPHPSNHQMSPKSQHYQSHIDHAGPHPVDRPTPPKPQQPSTNRQPMRSDVNSRDHPTPPKPPQQQQRHQSQPNPVGSERQPPKQLPPGRRRSPSPNGPDHPYSTNPKTNNPPPETRSTKSTKMRAAAIKQKEEIQEKKRKDGNFPGSKKKSTPPMSKPTNDPSDDEHAEHSKSKRTKKAPNSVPKDHKIRHNHHHRHTEDNNSTPDENNHDHHPRSKSKKRTAFSDSRLEKHPSLPPVRRGQGPPYYDQIYDYPYPYRGRQPYYDDYLPYPYYGHYGYRHFYDDPYDIPPYLDGYRDPYDGFFDYQKRKTKSRSKKHGEKKENNTDYEDHGAVTGNETEHEDDTKSVRSKKEKISKKSSKEDDEYEGEESARRRWARHYYGTPYYDEQQALEVWRQERNDYLKKTFKPTVHDVLYAQQWMKSDSYVENQRRRAVRDAQGYYFPYKKYTLKDYKDLQKQEAQQNPYATEFEPTLDRKERAKKRQEYASQIERQIVDTTGGIHYHTPRELPPRKPWHLNNTEPPDFEKLSKRERALEYAKEQMVKHRPQRAPKNRSHQPDPTEQYVNSLFPQENDDDNDEADERDNQSNDERE